MKKRARTYLCQDATLYVAGGSMSISRLVAPIIEIIFHFTGTYPIVVEESGYSSKPGVQLSRTPIFVVCTEGQNDPKSVVLAAAWKKHKRRS